MCWNHAGSWHICSKIEKSKKIAFPTSLVFKHISKFRDQLSYFAIQKWYDVPSTSWPSCQVWWSGWCVTWIWKLDPMMKKSLKTKLYRIEFWITLVFAHFSSFHDWLSYWTLLKRNGSKFYPQHRFVRNPCGIHKCLMVGPMLSHWSGNSIPQRKSMKKTHNFPK